MSAVIRPATLSDLPAIVAIYNHYIETDHCTFDTRPFTVAQRRPWFDQFESNSCYQCLLAEHRDEIVGYAHSGAVRPKPAYASSVETTIYLASHCTGLGVGKSLYLTLLKRLIAEPSLHRAYGVIAQPNDASNALHLALAYRCIGVQSEVGFKFGRYWDIAWYERSL